MKATILITGAARRLGASVARSLAGQGYFIIIHYHRSMADAAQLEHEIRAAGGGCGLVRADLTDRASVAGLISSCIDQFGDIDVLINNASGYQYDSGVQPDSAAWNTNLRSNLEAPVVLAQQYFVARQKRPGLVINMLDFKVANLNPDHFSYTIAKAGLAAATRMLAMAFKGIVRVNGVAPGLTLVSGRQTEAQFDRAWRATPLGRGPTPDEIATAVNYTINTKSLNGQILYLDGGASLRPRARDISVDPAALG